MIQTMLLTFFVYLIFYMGIITYFGFLNSRESQRSFWVAPQSAGPYVAAFAAGASDMSSWLFLALPGSVYLWGAQDIFLCLGLVIGAYCSWTWVAPILLVRYQQDQDSTSLIQLIVRAVLQEAHDNHRWVSFVKKLLTFLVLFFTCIYIAAGLSSIAKILEASFFVSPVIGKLLGVMMLMIVATVGGAVGLNALEIVQGIAIFILLGFLSLKYSYLNPADSPVLSLSTASSFSVHHVIYDLSWGFGYFGIPHILTRMSVLRDKADISKARSVLIFWMSFSLFFAFVLGFQGQHYFPSLTDHELLVPTFLSQSHPLFAGLGFALMIGSCLCAGTAQLLSSSASLSQDLFQSRLSTFIAVLSVLALSVQASYFFDKDIFSLVDLGWAGLTTSFAPSIYLLARNRTINPRVYASLLVLNFFFIWSLFIFESISPIGMMLPALSVHLILAHLCSKPAL